MKTTRTSVVLSAFAVLVLLVGCGDPPGGLGTLDFRKVVTAAKDKVFPAVVFVKCLTESHQSGKKITQETAGSGVIITPGGQMLTNWHVVDKAVEVRCLLLDGREMKAKVLGTDKDTDLALLALALPPGAKPLPYATLGDSGRLKEGDFVMAMGAPWGLNRSVSIGIVSCTRRYLPGNSEYSLWLQTDAAISPGNSGGPLVNTDGQVVGINTRAVMYGGDMGFAVPAETIQLIVSRLRKHGKANWSWTGLQLQPLKDFNKGIYFEGTEGVIVAETDPESPARRAGIRMRDRILTVNGQAVNAEREEDLSAVRRTLGLLAKNKEVRIELRRGKTIMFVKLIPRVKGKVEGEELDCPRWDLTVKTINQFDNPDLYFYRKQGVFIYGIKYPGNASGAGLNRKDIVIQIGGKDVKTLKDVKTRHAAAIKNVKTTHRIVFTVLRNGLMRQIVLDFARDYEKE